MRRNAYSGGGGSSVDLTAPGPIGGTTPGTGAFTALTAQSAALSGQSVTGSASTNLLDLTTTWNTTGAPVGIGLNVTNTASGAGARLLQLQTGGTTRLDVNASGVVNLNTDTGGTLGWRSDISMLLLCSVGSSASLGVVGVGTTHNRGVALSHNAALRWTSDTPGATADAGFERLLAGAVKLNNGSTGFGSLRLGTTSDAVHVGTHEAIGAETVTGFITIKDSGGTDRKIAVVS